MAATIQPEDKMGYRGRLAPSPTGLLHAGHARTFAVAWQRARAADGALVMRMEDLDRDRSRAEYAAAAIEDLRWLGLDWDEGPEVGGPYAPYTQSERSEMYAAAMAKLMAGGFVYPCHCSRKDLAAAVSAPHEGAAQYVQLETDDEPVYPGTCRTSIGATERGRAEFRAGLDTPANLGVNPANWRFRVPDGEAIEFVDGNLGSQRFVAGVDFGDFVVWRKDGAPGFPRAERDIKGAGLWGSPSYQLACVADDAAMQITEVVRGADLLKSTARQILLNRALGYDDPAWFHCALMTDASGKRLAKRHDALSIRALREAGKTPQVVLGTER